MEKTITGIVDVIHLMPGRKEITVSLRDNEELETNTARFIYTDLDDSKVVYEGAKVNAVELAEKLLTVNLNDDADPEHYLGVQVVLHPQIQYYGACTQAEFTVVKTGPKL